MSPTLIVPLISALLGTLLPLLRTLTSSYIETPSGKNFFESEAGKVLADILGIKTKDAPSSLFRELAETSSKMDGIVSRIQEYTKDRQEAVLKLEGQLGVLTEQESTLRKNIEDLQQVPLPAAEYFASVISKGEKSSALRDYLLFFAGVVVSVIVAIVLKHFNLA